VHTLIHFSIAGRWAAAQGRPAFGGAEAAAPAPA
jgi:hypothetical protein